MPANESTKQYDVALSFAGEDREYVEAVATSLKRKGLHVFYDKFEEADLAGRNLVDHLSEIYEKRARLCVVFVSRAYASKPFPRLERQAAQAKALEQEDPYIIPVRLDDTAIPGLLPTVAYVSGKTAESLSQLIASKLLLSESKGQVFPADSSLPDAVLIRFVSLIEPDMDQFRLTLQRFEHWADEKRGSIPIELRIPEPLRRQIAEARTFRDTESWRSPSIGEAARQQHLTFYDERLPQFLSRIARGVQVLIHHYSFSSDSRLELVVRRFVMASMTTLCRLLIDFRLHGMASPPWLAMFAQFSSVWSEWIMYGLSYACFVDGDEPFLWVDVDGRDTSDAIIWPQGRFRLYAPSLLLLNRKYEEELTADQFDRFFAAQMLEMEMDKKPGQPLLYFAEYPDRLRLTTRGEWVIDNTHFDQHSPVNSGGKPLFEVVRKLRDHVEEEAVQRGLSEIEQQIEVGRIRHLFGNQFDAILLPKPSNAANDGA